MADFLRLSRNVYGTPVSVHRCASCGAEFTVCPAQPHDFGGCLADSCPSYDLSRDVDLFFEPLAEAGLTERTAP